jgi:hypothetical protein
MTQEGVSDSGKFPRICGNPASSLSDKGFYNERQITFATRNRRYENGTLQALYESCDPYEG